MFPSNLLPPSSGHINPPISITQLLNPFRRPVLILQGLNRAFRKRRHKSWQAHNRYRAVLTLWTTSAISTNTIYTLQIRCTEDKTKAWLIFNVILAANVTTLQNKSRHIRFAVPKERWWVIRPLHSLQAHSSTTICILQDFTYLRFVFFLSSGWNLYFP